MKLPQTITIVESSYMLDGGTTTLHAVTGPGDECRIRLNQRVFDSYGNPGRLYFNDQLVEVRSDSETQIIELIKTASIAPKERPSAPPENRISKDALILSDDIKQVVENSPEENLRKFCSHIIAFVESDEYVEIAEHGLPKRK